MVSPLSVGEFFEKYWLPNEWIFIKSDISRFKTFPLISKLLSLKSFAPSYKGRVSLIHRDCPVFDVQGGDQALPYLEQGYKIYFRDVEDYFPEVDLVAKRLENDLEVPGFTSEIFASSGMSGVGMHSDYHLNLNPLLSGEKEWVYVKNTNIINQTSICLPSGVKQVDPTQLEYLKGTLVSTMPSNAQKVTQHPGDLMFVPRGWWHPTRSIGDCVSLNFIFKNPTWARLFASMLEKELVKNSEWRAYPYNINSQDVHRRKFAVDTFIKLIEFFKTQLKNGDSQKLAEKMISEYLTQITK